MIENFIDQSNEPKCPVCSTSVSRSSLRSHLRGHGYTRKQLKNTFKDLFPETTTALSPILSVSSERIEPSNTLHRDSSNSSEETKQKIEEIDGSNVKNNDDQKWKMAWKTLQHLIKVQNPTKLQSLFEEMGLTEYHELQHCEENDFRRLSECLKPIPRRVFLSLVGLNNSV